MQVLKKMNIYIYNRVEETFPQLPWFQVRCLEKTTALLHLAESVHFNVCVSVLRGITVSLVSPSFMRRISLAASRFLSLLQSSFRDTNPPRSSFSTYCNARKHVSGSTHCPAQKTRCIQSETYMGVLGVVEEKQRIPTQAGPQSPGCLAHTEISRRV